MPGTIPGMAHPAARARKETSSVKWDAALSNQCGNLICVFSSTYSAIAPSGGSRQSSRRSRRRDLLIKRTSSTSEHGSKAAWPQRGCSSVLPEIRGARKSPGVASGASIVLR